MLILSRPQLTQKKKWFPLFSEAKTSQLLAVLSTWPEALGAEKENGVGSRAGGLGMSFWAILCVISSQLVAETF